MSRKSIYYSEGCYCLQTKSPDCAEFCGLLQCVYMGQQTKILLFISGIIVGAGAVAIAPLFMQQEKPSDTEQVSPSEGVSAKEAILPTLINTSYKDEDTTTRIILDVSYPTISGSTNPETEASANKVIKKFINDIVQDLKSEEEGIDMDGIQGNIESTLSMTWEPMIVTSEFISLRFDYSAYSAGAAHPNNMSRVLNYDLAKGRILGTRDLFATPEEALPFLSVASRKALKKEMLDISKEEWDTQVLSGTEPIAENFKEVALTKEGLVVIFNPYQVAPYARGTQDILIGKNELTEKLAIEAQNALREVR